MPEPSQVLVIDDNPRMVALIKRWLVRAGYHVTGVTSVPEALKALNAHASLGDHRSYDADGRRPGYPRTCVHPPTSG